MKVKCTEHVNEVSGFTFGKIYEVIRKDLWMGYIVYDDYGNDSFLEEHECEVIEETPDTETSVEYTGEGLPPIGTICEIMHSGQGKFMEAEVVGFHKNDAIVYVKELFKYLPYGIEHICPIKSEKQKEIEELNKHLDHWFDNINDCIDNTFDVLTLSQYLYNLGYRKTK